MSSFITLLLLIVANILLMFVIPVPDGMIFQRTVIIGIVNGLVVGSEMSIIVLKTLKCDKCKIAPEEWVCGICREGEMT